MKNSFDNQELELGQAFIYSDGLRASASFYPSGLGASATLNFDIKDGKVFATTIEYSTETLNDGKKITIEIASNGYIMKSGGETIIAESMYDMKTKIEGMALVTEHFKFAYDMDEHNFTNFNETVNYIYNKVQEQAA